MKKVSNILDNSKKNNKWKIWRFITFCLIVVGLIMIIEGADIYTFNAPFMFAFITGIISYRNYTKLKNKKPVKIGKYLSIIFIIVLILSTLFSILLINYNISILLSGVIIPFTILWLIITSILWYNECKD